MRGQLPRPEVQAEWAACLCMRAHLSNATHARWDCASFTLEPLLMGGWKPTLMLHF